MQLKTYQQKALEQLDRWLDALKKSLTNSERARMALEGTGIAIPEELKNFPRTAWQSMEEKKFLPGIPQQDGTIAVPEYISRTATSGEPIPHVCLKVPTGGGKTLLGVAALERIKQETGFVLWIVPTKAIYEQTIKAFKTREHPYRQMLERISGGKVKLLEKTNHFTKQDIESYLCVMMLMLPSANREKGKEFLKIFRDSGGYTSFFPEQDDTNANQELSQKNPDLEKSKDGGGIKQSLINTLKLIRPTVILDEAHKAYGKSDNSNQEFVESVNRLNPRLVLELSATPKINISNILVNIGGRELQDENMIKLPINIHSFNDQDWQFTLTQTHEKLNELEQEAHDLQTRENRYVRPIALVRVQRTGRDQIEQGTIHSEDVREYLTHNLAVPENEIKIQSSEKKELAGEDLLSDISPVRWIITKDALKEGWDCSFAYVLALLDNTTAITTLTQMVGRVMRQPHAREIKKSDALNCCYIYCYNRDVGEVVKGVKGGLENEGLTGLDGAVHGEGEEDAPQPVTVMRRPEYKKLKIFLPQVLHREKKSWRQLDYDRDILSAVNWEKISGGAAVNLSDENIIQEIRVAVDIQGQRQEISEEKLDAGENLTLDYFVGRLTDIVPNPWQAARIAENFIQKHKNEQHDDSTLLNSRSYLSEVLKRNIQADIDKKAETVFSGKIKKDHIKFHLESDISLNYNLKKQFELYVAGNANPLHRRHGAPIQQSLFEPIYESDFNNLEKNVALYLDRSDAIYWWHRIAAKQEYPLQGWKRHKIYPDFIACQKDNGKLLVIETKGKHLMGNEDTEYKRQLLEILEKTYQTALERGVMTTKEPAAKFRMLIEDSWKEDLMGTLNNN